MHVMFELQRDVDPCSNFTIVIRSTCQKIVYAFRFVGLFCSVELNLLWKDMYTDLVRRD